MRYRSLFAILALTACSSSADLTADSGPDSGVDGGVSPDAASATKDSCAAWLKDNPSPSNAPAVPSHAVSQRSDMLAAGGKIVTIDSTYYTVTVSDSFFTSKTPIVIYSLHGTAGYPEAEWNDWHGSFTTQPVAFISLKWDGGTNAAASDETIYRQFKQIDGDFAKACPTQNARRWVMGFSVGSAVSFGVMVRDVADRKMFAGNIANSGTAWSPKTTGKDVMHPTVEAAKSNVHAYSGAKSWIYCGEQDTDHGWSMCDEAPTAVTFVNSHEGTATLFKDPTGKHGGLPKNPTAVSTMLAAVAN